MENAIHRHIRQHCLICIICFIATPLRSEVTLDGSIGSAQTLSGPDYQITQDLGERTGNNLFHSFGHFNLDNTETATFSGSPDIQNIISRVTGGQTSTIDGLLKSTIPNANLYFINPAGVFFGERARIDVQGSFHTSTANYLGFKDGVRFNSADITTQPLLTTAAPEAFGFLGNHPAGKITVSGGENSILEGKPGKTLSLIGGDINIKDSSLFAPGGQVNLASVDSAGEVIIGDHSIDTSSFTKMGKIQISRDPEITRTTLNAKGNTLNTADVDVSSDKAGTIYIRSGQLIIENTYIDSNTKTSNSGNIDIALTNDLIINENPIKTGTSRILSSTSGNGNSGNITITANRIKLTNNAQIVSEARTQTKGNSGAINLEAHAILLDGNEALKAAPLILTSTVGTGNSGAITLTSKQIDAQHGANIATITNGSGDSGVITISSEKNSAGTLALHDGSTIFTSSFKDSTGKAGDITIQTEAVLLSGVSMFSELPSSINSSTSGDGNAGDLSVTTDQLDIHNGAQILTSSFKSADGAAGAINIHSDRISLSGIVTIEPLDTKDQPKFFAAGIYSQTDSNGNSGDISVVSKNTLELKNAQISVSTAGSGNTGNLFVKSNHIKLTGDSDKKMTEISNRVIDVNKNNSATGSSGSLTVVADSLVSKGAFITTNNLGQGDSGPLVVNAKSILLTDGTENALFPGGITSEFNRNTPNTNSRVSGGISIKAEDLTMEAGTTISAANFGSGQVGLTKIKTARLNISNGATIDTRTFGSGAGGNLAVESGSITLSGKQSGLKSASAFLSTGNAGNITISTESLEMNNQALIDTSTRGLGLGGNITIHAPVIQLSGKNTIILSGSESSSFRDAGNITIFSSDLTLNNSAQINASTVSQGLEGFNTRVNELEKILTPETFKLLKSSIERLPIKQFASSIGNGGEITLNVDQLEITNKAAIAAITTGPGQAGDIIIDADNIFLRNAFIGSLSSKDNISIVDGEAMSGTIEITAHKRLQLENKSVITVQTKQANAGDIKINGEGVLLLSRNSKIETSVAGGNGKGGSITINSPVLALDTSSILASAVLGDGGNITISGLVFESPGSLINASSQVNMDGLVTLKPDTTISGSLSMLPSAFIDSSNQLGERCAARSASSSFVTKGRGNLPPAPGNLLPSNLLDSTTETDHQINALSFKQSYSDRSVESADTVSASTDSAPLVARKTGCGNNNLHL